MNKTELRKTLERASHCLDENDLDEAARLCTAVLHAAPRNGRAFHLRAIASQRSGRGREATEDAVQAASLRPDLPSLQVAAGSLLCREKLYDRALELYEAALRKDPSNAQYHLGAASALRKLGRGEQATSALRKAADAAAAAAATATAGPGDLGVQAQAQYKLGQHLRSTGEPHEAAAAYARCLQHDPGHVLAAFWLTATRKLAASTAREPQRDDSSSGSGDVNSGNSGRIDRYKRSCSPPLGEGTIAAAEKAVISPPAPVAAPREYVVGLYNAYAETFDSHLQGSLAYRTPTVIVETLRALYQGRRWRRCLDLGAGTGLSGLAASAVCDRLVGVDLSPAMVRRARDKRVYHRLLVGDVVETVERLCRESREAISLISGAILEAGSRTSARYGSRPGIDCGYGWWEVPATAEEEGGAVVGVKEGGDRSCEAAGEASIAAAGTAAVEAIAATTGGPAGLTGNGTEAAMSTAPPLEAESNHAHNSDASARSSCTTNTGSGGSNSSFEGEGDLVLSCDVFGYIGGLRACFAAVRELLMIGGSASGRRTPTRASTTTMTTATSPDSSGREAAHVFAFSAEAPPAAADKAGDGGIKERTDPSGPGYELQGTGRYSHSREYLTRVCRETGFRVVVADEVVLRKNAGVPVKGFVFVTEVILPSTPGP
ncbi:unnamed protein product [Scytosiphon promiscuus]